ncbi:hypothetical protein D1159_17040 [Pseudoflavonifractor sp. 524-17]|uniref:NAD/NADP octopine/nopaline dehydrogenase family protein n=1 Tax=Pseudoflavonifractor sp. 524-17 TaxID=2304577 RepID=UPI00137A93BD|nr:NAD/NADP octopine/nopaline dehydrogenase family protein [Pseudoflavonifractor sp. 524-17]NCE66231.1 hypothetical protein [Pseudoflavonifractor sp. 524-17]
MKKIAVIGAGGSGYSVAAELVLNGHEVRLCDILHDNGKADFTEHDVMIESTGSITGTSVLHTVTTDPAIAMEGAELVVCCTISNADEMTARAIAPYLKPDAAVLLSAGNLGSLIFRRVFDEARVSGVIVGETSGSLFSSRRTGENVVFFGNGNTPKDAAAFPASDTDKLVEAFRGIYTLEPVGSILEAAFNAPNLLSHISLTIVNAGAIENGPKPYYSFKQAICPSSIAIADALWKEKKAVMDALGFPCGPSPAGNFRKYADPDIHTFDDFKELTGPNSLQERHITEDAPIIGCLFLSVARAVGVDVPLYDALIKVAGAINHTDYYSEGRTLENLGLGHLRGVQVAQYFQSAG